MTVFQFVVVSRWIYFTSVSVLFGSSLFWLSMKAGNASAQHGDAARAVPATAWLLRMTAAGAAMAGTAWLIGIFANIAGGFAQILDFATWHLFFFATPFGTVSLIRLALMASALAIAFAPLERPIWLIIVLLISLMLMISQAWLGHAAEGGATLYGAMLIATYIVHVVAAAAWVGSLPALLLALMERRPLHRHDGPGLALEILSRYSLMAMIAVVLIIFSGIAQADFRVAGAFDKLLWTGYGEVLLAKVALVGVMLLFAGFNRFVAMPSLHAAIPKSARPMKILCISVATELSLGLLVFGLAAVLGTTPPPR